MKCPRCGEDLGLNSICINPICSYFGATVNSPEESNSSSDTQDNIHTHSNITNSNNKSDNNLDHNNKSNFGLNSNNKSNFDFNYNNFTNANTNSYNNEISTEEFTAFIGEKNTNYYLKLLNKKKIKKYFLSWNWPCFFLSNYWLLYRKLYMHSIALILFAFVSSKVLEPKLFIFFMLIMRIILSLFANAVYLNNAEKKIKAIKTVKFNLSAAQYSSKLHIKGGVNIIAPLILLCLYLIFATISIALILFSTISPPHNFSSPGYHL